MQRNAQNLKTFLLSQYLIQNDRNSFVEEWNLEQ